MSIETVAYRNAHKRFDCRPRGGWHQRLDAPLQEAVPDAVSFERKHIVDDKHLGRPIAKDRQEIIRFIKAYEQREGHLPKVIGIKRYDPQTGQQVLTELYSPKDFLP